ncbi:cell adhesion molecule Dscam2-like [Bacillus rossius redtenbacheri]|uniref:cell adhesion molecule Dscam2-like n=1 Tax=Bacillus rossius redtenbacheri TaxID=93214 RepID=UPI002FDE4BAD
MRVLLSCSIISGDFPITISWRKDGGPLPQDLDIQEKHEEFGSTLAFRNMAAKHSGHYTCIASNAAASTNYTAKLTIRVPPAWVLEPQDTSALFQHPASLHCQASGFPTPTITWLRGKGDEANEYTRLESGSKLILYGNGTVLIRAVDPSHEGHYTCQASNGIGSGLSKAIFLQVNVPAHFKLRTANQSGVVGDGALLTCEAEGDLPLRVSWSEPRRPSGAAGGGRGIATERHTRRGVTAELRLERLARGDAGAYRCSAANNFGQDEMVVHLAVKEPPEAPHGARIQEVGSRWASVAWGGGPEPPALHYVVRYRAGGDTPWNNVTVDGGSRAVRLGGLRPATTYLVRVLAVNEVGAGPAGEVLRFTTLQEAPSGPPTDVFAKAVTPRSIVVQWKPPVVNTLHSKVLGYKVGYRDVSGGTHRTRTVRGGGGGGGRLEVTLASLRQFARYEITVRAFNAVGPGPASPPLLVTTLEGVPDKPPEDVHCTALSSQSIRVRWEPPHPDHRNGVIEGYKVLYRHISSKQGAQHAPEVKKTTNLETNLHGLAKHGNYSVRVLAYTGAGEGSRSGQLHCVTEEDIPGPPEFVKALVMTSDSILVSWTPPAEPNGRLLKYTVYIHSVQNGNQDVQREEVFGDGELMLEARQMKEHHRYEFWVTAATGAGEGPSSVRVAQTPTSRVPARIASFSRAVAVGAGRSAVLACRAVGLPAPTRSWRGPGGGPVSARHEVLPGRSLALAPLRPGDAGNYSCLAENVFGRDEVTYALSVLVPPGPPALSVAGVTADSLALVWRVTSTGGSPVTGFVLKHKQERGDWQSLLIDADYSAFTLQGIRCGTSHQLSLSAANAMGTGKPSAVVSAATTGAAPKVPLEEDFLAVNSTSATLYLEAWPDGGCPIRFFALEYRPWGSGDWTRLPRSTARDELTITDLRPATWYALKVAAHNDAGYSQQEFVFATRTQAGETVMPYVVPNMSEQQTFIYSHLNIIIPVLSGIVCTVAISVCVCIAVSRRSYNCAKDADPGSEAKSLAELENQRNSKQQGPDCNHSAQLYLPSPTRKGDSSLSYQKGSDTSGQDYEIGPYATFSLPCKNSAGGTAAGMQTMDYCVQFQTFNQQECYAGQTRPGPSGRFGKEYYSCSSGDKLLRSANSPPDGLSLEISCISSQQTLPLPVPAKAGGVAPCQGRSHGCDPTDSDSSGQDKGRAPVCRHRTPRHTPHSGSGFELDSSTESAEASPDMKHHTRRRAPQRETSFRRKEVRRGDLIQC